MRRPHLWPSSLPLSLCLALPAQGEPPATPPPAAATPAAPAAAAEPAAATAGSPFRADMVRDLAWRNLGPVNPVGRVTDLEVHPARQSTWFVGTGGGGVWRTQNAGTTWSCVFEREGTASIGDVAIAPSNPDVVWVGTGEENARNSVQWGDGVYKSTDGGTTWAHMGLRETFQIGHVEIHPTNPDIVYVAALGRLWGDSDERGVYKTTDGGKSWQRVLFLDVRTGCIDVRLLPDAPDTLLACMYERRRDAFDGNDPAVRFGQLSGLYKSTDGGQNWRELTQGLPSCQWGRSGLDVYAKDPNQLFLIVETERSGWAKGDRKDRLPTDEPDEPQERRRPGGGEETPSEAPQEEAAQPGQPGQPAGQRPARAPGGRTAATGGRGSAILGIGSEGEDGKDGSGAVLTQVTDGGPAAQAGLKPGDRITKIGDEAIKAYADLIEIVRDSAAGQKVVITYVRGEATATAEATYGRREDQASQVLGGGNGPYSGRLFGQNANVQKRQGDLGYETGGVFRSTDRGETWTRLNSLTERPFYYSVIRVDPRDAQAIYCVGTTLWGSQDGGEKFAGINRGIHVDFHAIWVDPDDSDHLLAGCDGGVNETFDRGKTWQVHHGFSVAQYYDVVADNSVPYRVIGGLQDNGTWVGPSRTRYREGITHADWVTIYGGDGFGAQTDPVEPWLVFATSQNGALGLVDLRTGGQARVQRERPPKGEARFNWDAPFALSPHNRLTVWHAGNFVWRGERYAHLDNRTSRPDQGPLRNQDGIRMRCVSPELGLSERGTATALAESPRVPGLLYVGTDDGALWRSEDGAHTWTRIDQNLPIPAPRYVSDLVPSHFADNRVYLTLDGHRCDDFATYVFVSNDRGATWQTLGTDLPTQEPCYAVMEDPRREDLLFLGTEYGCHVSLDRGAHWFPLGRLPTVAVRDLFVQDRDSDLIAATHGRGVFVLDIEPLRQLTERVAKSPAHLFAVEPAILWRMQSRGLQGHREPKAPNPPYGAVFHVWLAEAPKDPPVLTVHDVTGAEVAKVTGKAAAGLQAIVWDARLGQNRLATPGSYAVRWSGRDDVAARPFQLLPDPEAAAAEDATTPSTENRE